MQDDAVAAEGWLAALLLALDALQLRHGVESPRRWGFLKLFYHEYWDGWEDEDAPLLALLGVAGAVAGLALWGVAALTGRVTLPRPVSAWDRWCTVAVVCVWGGALAVGLPLLVGKQNLLAPPSPGVRPPNLFQHVGVTSSNPSKTRRRLAPPRQAGRSAATRGVAHWPIDAV